MKTFLKYSAFLLLSIGFITVDNHFTAQYGAGMGDIVQGLVTGLGAIGIYAMGRLDEAKERDQN